MVVRSRLFRALSTGSSVAPRRRSNPGSVGWVKKSWRLVVPRPRQPPGGLWRVTARVTTDDRDRRRSAREFGSSIGPLRRWGMPEGRLGIWRRPPSGNRPEMKSGGEVQCGVLRPLLQAEAHSPAAEQSRCGIPVVAQPGPPGSKLPGRSVAGGTIVAAAAPRATVVAPNVRRTVLPAEWQTRSRRR